MGLHTPDETRPYRLPDCDDDRCGLPRLTPGRMPYGWLQVHYATQPNSEPDRWYCGPDCATFGMALGFVVAAVGDSAATVDAAREVTGRLAGGNILHPVGAPPPG